MRMNKSDYKVQLSYRGFPKRLLDSKSLIQLKKLYASGKKYSNFKRVKTRFKSRALTKTTRQIGKSNLKIDKKLKALSPGKRRSSKGKIYYEYRKNHTDVKGRDTPKTKKQKRKSQRINNANKLLTARRKAYNAKKTRREEKLAFLAKKSKRISQEAYKRSNKLSSLIPMGQPILVGHHSERSHRAQLKRIRSAMDRSVSESNKAAEYERRLASAKNNYSISSDDPDAIKKLTKKLSLLERKREGIKNYNKRARKEKKEPHPRFVLSNLGQNINSIKKRIEFLKKQSKRKFSSKVVKGVKIIENIVINRLQIEFPGKPNAEIRTLLKRNGFRWSPREGKWQRQLNNSARYSVKTVLDNL